MDRQKKLGDRMNMGKSFGGPKTKPPKKNSDTVASKKKNFGKEHVFTRFYSSADDSSSHNRPQGFEPVHGDAQSRNATAEADFVIPESRVMYSLDFKSKEEKHDIRTKLRSELNSVRNLLKRMEHYSVPKLSENDVAHGGKLKRVHSEFGSVDGYESRLPDAPSLPRRKDNQAARSKFGKGTSQPQKSSDSSFVKEKIHSSNQAKKSRIDGKKNAGELGSFLRTMNSSSKVFKFCSGLLDKLMRQKNAWVFNNPVDVEGLGLNDYFHIIKDPMDLGTVKSRLTTDRYGTPEELADDVRLTFRNAMTYNAEGHQINTLARQMLQMFEDKWAGLEVESLGPLSTVADSEVELPTPVSARAPLTPPPPPPTDMPMILDRSESTTNPACSEGKVSISQASGRTRLPKPKAKDPNKRDMTSYEKEKLSASLQDLPPEKLDGVLRIIKKRNPSISQNDDEIELDIDSLDKETLWELDRFVIYYKKSLSKMKRSAEMSHMAVKDEANFHEKNEDQFVQPANGNRTDDKSMLSSPSVEREKEGINPSVSDHSSSSSSDSGSSSSGKRIDESVQLLAFLVSLPKLMLQGLIWLSNVLSTFLCSRIPHCTKPRSCSQISAIVPAQAVIVLVYSRLQELHSMG
ncbi:hypothetical protein V2J09_006442 [Rumex salicifolius]